MQSVNTTPIVMGQQFQSVAPREFVLRSDLDLLSARVDRIERSLATFDAADRAISRATHRLAIGIYDRVVNGAGALVRTVILNEPQNDAPN